MPFPISHQATLSWNINPEKYKNIFPNNSLESLKEVVVVEIAKELGRAKGRDTLIQINVITFRGGMFRLVNNRNILSPITGGRIEVALTGNRVTVDYYLIFMQMLVGATLIFISLGLFVSLLVKDLPLGMIGMMAVICIWCFIMNFLIGINRFSSFLKKAVERNIY